MSWQSPAAAAVPVGEEGDSDATEWTITEVRERAGISARTLRYYEEMGLLPGVRRRAGGRRVYGPDARERIRFIQRLKALGLSLAEIKELNAVYGIGGSTGAMLSRLEELLARHRAEVDARIGELSALRDEIDAYRARIRRRVRAADKKKTKRSARR